MLQSVRKINNSAACKDLEEHGAMDYTIIVSASADESAPLQYIAPYAGCAMAEEFLEQGRHSFNYL